MRLLVCGGRNFTDRDLLFDVLDVADAANTISHLIHGNAKGADALADDWAVGKCETLTFTPAWEKQGNAAGPIRNMRMLVEGRPDLVIAFKGGRGTADMVQQAYKHGVPVVKVGWGRPPRTLV